MATAPLPFLSPEEYFELDAKAEWKSEYWDGRMYAMASGTAKHSDASMGIGAALRGRLLPKGCRVFNSDLRVRASRSGYTYPDLAVVCGKPEFEGVTLTNPVALIEVLSPSTEAGDRGFKFGRYQNIGSLREYVLVSQHAPLVETFLRQPDESWRYRKFEGLEAVAQFESVGVEVPLAEIYNGLEFVDWFAGGSATEGFE
jgi:Uma2 family endonuclease